MSDKAKPKAVAKAKKPEASHPTSSVMVKAALENLKERKGSSLAAIKKYIGTNYKADPVKMSVFIKKALKSGVEKKTILQVKGVGASGSFKLAKPEAKPKTAAKPKKKVAKKATPSKPKKKVAAKSKPAAAKKATPKKKVEKSKSAKPSAKPKKPVAKKAASKKPAKKAAPKKK